MEQKIQQMLLTEKTISKKKYKIPNYMTVKVLQMYQDMDFTTHLF